MTYGRGPLNKYEYAATIAASLAYLVLRQQDAVSCAVFDEQIRMRVPSRTRRSHLQSVIDSLAVTEPPGEFNCSTTALTSGSFSALRRCDTFS